MENTIFFMSFYDSNSSYTFAARNLMLHIMTKETRTDVQIYSAIAMLLAGVALATAGFIVPPTGEISDSVLLFFAQCLIYAGSIFGVSIYIHTKFAELKSAIEGEEGGQA